MRGGIIGFSIQIGLKWKGRGPKFYGLLKFREIGL
jgi:hypothetical protein